MKNNKAMRWTKEEDAMLTVFYKTGTWSLGKPRKNKFSIRKRAKRLLNAKLSKTFLREIAVKSHATIPTCGKVVGSTITTARMCARLRGLDDAVLDGSIRNMKYLNSIAKNTCALSGIPIIYKKHNKDSDATASLDRIDSSKGYVKGNVQWVHKDVNKIKNNLSEKRLMELCKSIYLFNRKTL